MFYNQKKDHIILDFKDYEILINELDNRNIHKYEIIDKIMNLPINERFYLVALLLFVDYNINGNKIDSEEITEEVIEGYSIPIKYSYPVMDLLINRNDIVEQFKVINNLDGVENNNSGNEVLKFLEQNNIARYTKNSLRISIDSSLYFYLLNFGITGFEIFNKDGFFYPPPFYLMIVEFLSYYFNKGISIIWLSEFLHLPFELCRFWINRIEYRKKKYTNFSFETGGSRKVSLTMEDMLEAQTWYYLEFFNKLKLDGVDSCSPRDVVAVSSMYVDTLRKVKELKDKDKQNQGNNLLNEYDNINSLDLLREGGKILQSREQTNINKKIKSLRDDILENKNE